MGFSESQAKAGLAATGGVVENAAAWLLDHPEAGQEGPASAGASNAGEGGEGLHVHQAACDRCKKQIVGTRYKCGSCRDFDLCPSCYPMRVMWHDDEHDFVAHETELLVDGHLPGQAPKKELTDEEKKRVEAKNTGDSKRKWEEQKQQMEAEKARR